MTYLLVDGENVDSTLGTILRRQPNPEDRPRWDQVVEFAQTLFGNDKDVKPFFFINVKPDAKPPHKFTHVLDMMGYKVILLQGKGKSQVVDSGIKKMLDLIVEKPGNIILVTHDNGYVEHLVKAMTTYDRGLAIFGFEEFVSAQYAKKLPLTIYDLETQVGAFQVELPRGGTIEVEEFDPTTFFDEEVENVGTD